MVTQVVDRRLGVSHSNSPGAAPVEKVLLREFAQRGAWPPRHHRTLGQRDAAAQCLGAQCEESVFGCIEPVRIAANRLPHALAKGRVPAVEDPRLFVSSVSRGRKDACKLFEAVRRNYAPHTRHRPVRLIVEQWLDQFGQPVGFGPATTIGHGDDAGLGMVDGDIAPARNVDSRRYEHAHRRVTGLVVAQDFQRPVVGAAVDDDDFVGCMGLAEKAIQ